MSRASGARSSAERPQAKGPASQKRSLPAPSNASKHVRFEISNEAVTESVPEAVDDASDDAPVDTPANAPDKVSNLQESIDNESPREPPAENEEEEAARALYTTKERFKKLVYKRRVEEARRRLQEAEEGTYIPTSDIEEEMDELLRAADYPVALYLRIYLNKMLVVRKALPDSTRHMLDIADIEEIFLQSLQPFVKDKDYEVISCTAIVRLATGRGGSKAHNIDNLPMPKRSRSLLYWIGNIGPSQEAKYSFILKSKWSVKPCKEIKRSQDNPLSLQSSQQLMKLLPLYQALLRLLQRVLIVLAGCWSNILVA